MTDEKRDPFIVMAEALEAVSAPPLNSDPVDAYVRNDAFQTMARALRAASENRG